MCFFLNKLLFSIFFIFAIPRRKTYQRVILYTTYNVIIIIIIIQYNCNASIYGSRDIRTAPEYDQLIELRKHDVNDTYRQRSVSKQSKCLRSSETFIRKSTEQTAQR